MKKYLITEHERCGRLKEIARLEVQTLSIEAAKHLATINRTAYNTMLRVEELATGEVRQKIQNAWIRV